MAGRKPDYNVSALDKATDRRGKIGVAWKQDDGSIQVKLDAFVVLDARQHDLLIALFPMDGTAEFKKRKRNASNVDVGLSDGDSMTF